MSSEWFEIIATAIGRNVDVSYVCQTDKLGDLETIIPFFRHKARYFGIPLNVCQLGSNLMSYHAEIVGIGDYSQAICELIDSNADCHMFHFANLDEGSPTHAELNRIGNNKSLGKISYRSGAGPYLEISGSFQDLVSSKNKKFRYKFRQRNRKVVDDERIRVEKFETLDQVEYLLSHIKLIESNSWKEEKGLAISQSAVETDYYARLLRHLVAANHLFAEVMFFSETPIGYTLCSHFDRWVGNMKTSFDRSFSEYSPGLVLLDRAIARSFDVGAQEFDFLGTSDPYKMSWASNVRVTADCFLFSKHLRSKLICRIKRSRATIKAAP